MSITNATSGVNLAALGSGASSGAESLGKDDFLQLLVTQLTNQNPLSPVQDQEFVAQLAQFSSLEQLENLNETMNSSLVLDQAVNNSLATNLIGKEVLIEGNETQLASAGAATWQLALGDEASVKAVVRDANGDVVRTLEIGKKVAGVHSLEWDGLNESGERAAAGAYTLEVAATDAAGNAVASASRVRALVTGVRFVDGTGYLILGDVTLPLGAVVEVAAPRTAS